MSRILVTGAAGFIGKNLVEHASKCGCEVFASTRRKTFSEKSNIKELVHTSIDALIDECEFPKSVDCVIHLAGLAHITPDKDSLPLSEYRKINTEATFALAKKCESMKVKRFIFVSSVGVGGSFQGRPLTESDPANPIEDYAISKFDAEKILIETFKESTMELIIVRPPLVYGYNAPGNFARLINLVKTGFPLPIKNIDNKRSFIGIYNLLDFLMCCINFPSDVAVKSQVYYISDDEDLSTKEFIGKISKTLRIKTRYFWIPSTIFNFLLRILRKQKEFEKAFGTLTVDIVKAKTNFAWKPRYSVSQQLDLIFEERYSSK